MSLSEYERNLLIQAIEGSYITLFQELFGVEAQNNYKLVCKLIKRIYSYIEPGVTSKQIIIFRAISHGFDSSSIGNPSRIRNFRHLPTTTNNSLVIQSLATGDFENVNEDSLFWCPASFDAISLSQDAIVYEFIDGVEWFVAKGQRRPLNSIGKSIFSTPTFSDLETALLDYKDKMVRHSTCFILKDIWYDDNRLFLWNGREYVIRRSLKQYLLASLRGDVEVREEQNVDETHPVDIKVTWRNCNRLALIEIKWLGKSKNQIGKITQNFTASRAVSGAKQLVEYLDSNKTHAPTNITCGYLVILDARRAKLTENTNSLGRDDGFKYENLEINFQDDYHRRRPDFSEPIRMFAEPKCMS